jgi:hypothetical protein
MSDHHKDSRAAGDQLHESLAGDKPIFRLLSVDPRYSEIVWLAREITNGELDVDPPYQRGSVWGVERQRNLIRSLSMGLPIGAIFINERDLMEPDIVVDGKQRLLAVKAWIEDELAVPADWFPDEYVTEADEDGMVRYSQLTETARRAWRTSGVHVNRTTLQGPDAVESEAALFDLINFGGVPQGESDPDA